MKKNLLLLLMLPLFAAAQQQVNVGNVQPKYKSQFAIGAAAGVAGIGCSLAGFLFQSKNIVSADSKQQVSQMGIISLSITGAFLTMAGATITVQAAVDAKNHHKKSKLTLGISPAGGSVLPEQKPSNIVSITAGVLKIYKIFGVVMVTRISVCLPEGQYIFP